MFEPSFSLTTFSSDGKLPQLQNAMRAVQRGGTSIGIKTKDGVIILAEKKNPTELIEHHTLYKINNINDHIGVVYSGFSPDYSALLNMIRKEAMKYYYLYGEHISIGLLTKKIGSVMQEFTQKGGIRPFGVSLILCSYDYRGSHLYQIEPSGTIWSWKAVAIGKNSENCQKFLEKTYETIKSLEDAIIISIRALKESFSGYLDEKKVDIGFISSKDKTFRRFSTEEIKEYLENQT